MTVDDFGLLVELMLFDVFVHSLGEVVAKWFATCRSVSYLTRSDLEQRRITPTQ
jgi:hypothetical protein